MPDLKEVLEAAKNAKTHARSRVFKGTTHDDGRANQYSSNVNQRDALRQSIIEMRDLIHDESKLTPNPLEKNYADLVWFETNIKFSTKYSLGNCYEYTLQALDYVLQKNPEIDGEIFRILRGDHYFLVLNRDPTSDPSKPETWGDNAVICDPWLNAAYQAKDYKKQLGDVFDPEKGHKIVIGDATLTVASLYDVRTLENLEANFLQEINHLKNIIEECKQQWSREKDKLNSSGKEKGRFAIIRQTQMLQTFIEKLNNTKCEYKKTSYRGIRDQLLDQLELLKQEAEYVTTFSPEDKQTLGFFAGAQEGGKNKPQSQIIAEEANVKLRKV